jgi:hypothetical protein
MIPTNLQNDLIKIWKDIFKCSRCALPDDYTPQFRPVGTGYQAGGVLFAQINPGHIGCLTPNEIEQRYKRESSKQKAQHKKEVTSELICLQNTFSESPRIENWNQLNLAYNNAICNIWGWPPGKYLSTIEKHGVNIGEVALINLAQCPVPKDKYTKLIFSNCWKLHIKRLLDALKPRIIVAQGKATFNFLKEHDLNRSITLIEGNHHASRQSNETKKHIFHKVKSLVEQSVA